jgi:hypothetical protein
MVEPSSIRAVRDKAASDEEGEDVDSFRFRVDFRVADPSIVFLDSVLTRRVPIAFVPGVFVVVPSSPFSTFCEVPMLVGLREADLDRVSVIGGALAVEDPLDDDLEALPSALEAETGA